MAIKLRKKAPFTCRHIGLDGNLDHFMHPLAETDGDLCPQHAAARIGAEKKFLAPLVAPKQEEPEPNKYGDPSRWPIWPTDTETQEVA